MGCINLLSSNHLVLNCPPWNSAHSSFSLPKSPQSPILPHQKRTIFPSATYSDEARFIHSCMILLIVCRKRQTDTQMGRQTVVSFFLREISQPCCLKKLILFHSPLIKSQCIPWVHGLLQQHTALDLAFPSSEGSDAVLAHVWCLAFRIKCSFLCFENPADMHSSPEHVDFEVVQN